MFRFDGDTIPCIVLRHGKPAPELQTYRTHFQGVNGISEIIGGRGGRQLEFPVILHKKWARRQSMEDYVEFDLNLRAFGENGNIAYTANEATIKYDDCTFHGFFMDPNGPLFDYSGTLEEDGTRGWFCSGMLLFFQLVT